MVLTITQYHYLVVISQLKKKIDVVKSIDVAIELGVARATTSRMINYLASEGWIIRNGRSLTLSKKAEQLLDEAKKHESILFTYFSKMNLDSFEIKECVDALTSNVSTLTLNKITTYLQSKNHD